MITKEEAKKLLLIDEYKLEKECKIQPSIYQEIAEQHKYIKKWGGEFMVTMPEIKNIEANQ